jgi:hypothetical protein
MTKAKPMTASEMGKRRWKGLTKAQRAEIARAGALKANANIKAKKKLAGENQTK